LVCLILAITASLFPQAGRAASRIESPTKAPFAAQFAIADFDGDQKPDLASVRSPGSGSSRVLYLIDFRLSGGARHTYGLEGAAGGVRLASRDVNGDRLLDLIVTSTLTGQPLAVFLNDGRGNFTRSEPAAYPEAYREAESSLGTADFGDEDRSGAELSQNVPARSESAGRVVLKDNHQLPTFTNLSSTSATSCRTWLGRAPPESIALS
jgi:hypothetical protein